MSDQDYLKKSLVDLQAELETFKGLQETLWTSPNFVDVS